MSDNTIPFKKGGVVKADLPDLVITKLEKALIESYGQITPEIAEWLTVDLTNPVSIDATFMMLERMKLNAQFWDERAKEAALVKTGLQMAEAKLKTFVKEVMKSADTCDLEGVEYRFKLGVTKPRACIDEEKLPKEYFKEKITMVPDKERVEQDLGFGVEIPGATLEPVFSLRTYPVKKALV